MLLALGAPYHANNNDKQNDVCIEVSKIFIIHFKSIYKDC